MAGIVALAGVVGVACSATLLWLGLESMAIRYLVASACAYVFFVATLRWWMATWHDEWSGSSDAFPSFDSGGDGPSDAGGGGDGSGGGAFHGGGGDFGGGGASGWFDTPSGSSLPNAPFQTSPSPSSSFRGSGIGDLGDLDPGDAALPLLVMAMFVAFAFASLYVVWIAPSLLAELLLDGVLSYTLFRHVRGLQGRHWLGTALRRTMVPFACTAIFLSGSGLAMAARVPCARSIGDVVHRGDPHAHRDDAHAGRGPTACVQRPHRHRHRA